MKKFLSFLLVVCLFIPLVACNNSTGKSKKKDDSKNGKTTGLKIAYCDMSMKATWRTQMRAEFEQKAKELKKDGTISEYYITNANDDATKQISDVKDMIAKGVDGIVISAVSTSAISPVVEEAMNAGIKVVSFNMLVDTDNVVAKVYQPDEEFGRIGAQFIADKLNGKGKIICLNGTAGNGCNDSRWRGAEKVFKKYPGIKIVATSYCDWEYAKAKAATESLLSANPDIDGVWSQGGAMTQGAIDAFIASNRKLVPMSGEAGNGFLRTWKENKGKDKFDSIAPIYEATMVLDALDTLLDSIAGKKVEKEQVLPMKSIKEDQIDEYYRSDLPDSYWAGSKLTKENLKKLFK